MGDVYLEISRLVHLYYNGTEDELADQILTCDFIYGTDDVDRVLNGYGLKITRRKHHKTIGTTK